MTTLIKKEIRERRTSLIIYCLVGIASVWLYVSLFPSLQAQAKDLTKIFNAMPKEVLKAFGAEGTGLEGVESLLAGKQFGLVWPILAIILMLNRAANALAGETERGTLGTLLSQPISRGRIYLAKYYSAVITLLIFIIFSVLVNIPFISAYHLAYSLQYELLFAGVCALYGLAILGVGMAVSAIVSERSKVYGLVGGSIMLMFILNVVSSLQPSIDRLKYLSVFYYFNAHDMMVNHHINMASVALFSFTALASAVTGWILFSRRDLNL